MTQTYPRLRTDRNRNPAAFTTDMAKQAGLREGIDYVQGDQFPDNTRLWTAKLLGDPVALTIQLIDALGYFTKAGTQRWNYIAMPSFVWQSLTPEIKKRVVAFHYEREGGTEMLNLFK